MKVWIKLITKIWPKLQYNYNFADFIFVNHPVHIITKDKKLSPSAFIPFCDFGGDISALGVKIDGFKIPVCNSFQDKILNNKHCYEIDLNRFTNKNNLKRELKLGFNFLLDYNEDRQILVDKEVNGKKDISLASNIVEREKNLQATIYLNTLGKKGIPKKKIYTTLEY